MSPWVVSGRADPRAVVVADRHYNRQKPGTKQFVPPGRCFVLLTPDAGALWVTSWPFAQYVKHEWAGAWVNSLFRRETGPLASDLIRSAIAATRWYWPTAPEVPSIIGPVAIVTFIDRGKVKRKRDYGRCYLRAGFREIGETKGGLLALGMKCEELPEATEPEGGAVYEGKRRNEHRQRDTAQNKGAVPEDDGIDADRSAGEIPNVSLSGRIIILHQ